ncbi:hypothetical protein QAD02_016802 [Eretmocerus hayati]|uniref:Uncharacterized protein n=1 Tax=Eretmocerus hayati TaxID=131215 RepID=A0ACC2PGX6_9HYME|nr:hypothetical protein QAD02_016802 [Eretmocerus hayati]
MATPVLTKAQQRRSLSAKKGPVKGLKNVLAQPFDNFWPVLKNDHEANLEILLKELLPVLKRSEIKVPWSKLRKMNKEERSAAKKAIQIEPNESYDENAVKSVVMGINGVTKLLEKNDVCGILLDATVTPSLLIKHIVAMAQKKDVPVLLIAFLKKLTLDLVGFASASFGLRKFVSESEENLFYPLFKKIEALSEDIPKRKTAVALFQNEALKNESDVELEELQNSDVDMKEVPDQSPPADIYLYRSSRQERIFKPVNLMREQCTNQNSGNDFIALSDDKYAPDKVKLPTRFFEVAHNVTDGDMSHKSQKLKYGNSETSVVYQPLRVKRMQGNESRTKATRPSKAKRKK